MPSILGCFFFAISSSLLAQTKLTFAIALKPLTGSHKKVFAIDVSEVVEGTSSNERRPLSFGAPLMLFGNGKLADRVSNFEVMDPSGKVSPSTQDDNEGEEALRRWTVNREITYPITMRYRVAVLNAAARSNPLLGYESSRWRICRKRTRLSRPSD